MTMDNPQPRPDFPIELQSQYAGMTTTLEVEAALEGLQLAKFADDSQRKTARTELYDRLNQLQNSERLELSPKSAQEYNTQQRAVTRELAGLIRGDLSDLDVSYALDRREWQLVDKVTTVYQRFQQTNPGQPFVPAFTDREDVLVWDTMIKRETLGRVAASPPSSEPQASSAPDTQKQADTQKDPELDKVDDHEHIVNAPAIRVVPDTHGLDPAYYGVDVNSTNVVSVGDLIDAPKNLNKISITTDVYRANLVSRGPNRPQAEIDEVVAKFDRAKKAAESVDIKKSVEVWTDLLESGKGQVVLGNHELMALSALAGNDNDMWQWIMDSNKGGTTLAAFGIKTPNIWVDDKAFNIDVDPAECARIRNEVAANPTLSKFFEQVRLKGKMYMIANEALIVHAGVPVSPDGDLIPPQRRGQAFEGFEGLTGLDALEKIEAEIRKQPPNQDVLHWLGNGSSKEMTPAWVREPFFDVMNDPQKAFKVREQLRAQAKARGGNINVILIGHTEKVGGKRTGELVFGTDTAVGDIVTLERAASSVDPNKDKVMMKVSHNFGSKDNPQPFGYGANKISS